MVAHDEPPLLVSGSLDGTVRVWDLQRAAAQDEHPRHWDRVTTLARFDADRQLLTSSYDGTLKIWRMADGSVSRTIDPDAGERVTSAALLDRSRVVYALANGTVVVLDLKTGRASWSTQVHRYGMGVVAAVPDMRAFVTGDRYGWVKVWTERRKEWTARQLGTPGDVVDGIVVAASGQHVLAWDCGERHLQVYDLEKGADDDDDDERFWRLRFAGTNEAVILLPGNRFAFPIVEDDRHAVVGCSIDTLKPFVRLAVPEPVTALAADARGARVAIGMQDGTIDVRALRGKGSPSRLFGHAAEIDALRFVDDRLLVSAAGSTLRLWDVARGVTLAVFGADGPLHHVSVGDRPACLIATELSGRVHFLEIADRPPQPTPTVGARRPARPRSRKPPASRRR